MIKLRKAGSGQTLVEYALMLPLLVLIILFLVDGGRAVYYYSVLHNAAREGARWGVIVPEDTAGIEAAARAKAVGLNPANLTVLSAETKTETEWYITVLVTYDFNLVTPLISVIFGGNPLTLDSQSRMNVEG
jgi:Flp pilus assembly protein TadG